ncbi:proteasome maturation protein [Periplaneta americana]|uniref:proteasome maturation protein n=1 Tax=Periplaneta americana TaxID=6978 RepID=UPI0037E92D6D
MSFGLPALKTKPTGPGRIRVPEGSYGIPDALTCGLQSTKSKLAPVHTLEKGELQYAENRRKMDMMMLRNTQGLHVPLRLNMELQAAKKIGRLPFLPSSGFMADVLTGRDEEIGFEDILNTADFREQMAQPHAVVEKQLGLL